MCLMFVCDLGVSSFDADDTGGSRGCGVGGSGNRDEVIKHRKFHTTMNTSKVIRRKSLILLLLSLSFSNFWKAVSPHVVKEDTEPWFIYHAGPGKTGTTSIQCYGGLVVETLVEDNIYFFGDANHCGKEQHSLPASLSLKDYALCARRYPNQCEEMKISLQHDIEYHRNKNQSVYISTECSSDEMINLLTTVLKGWKKSRVIVTYRPYHEYLISLYGQIMKMGGTTGRSSKNKWPSIEEDNKICSRNLKEMQSFPTFYKNCAEKYHRSMKKVYNNRVYAGFSEYRIFNMHNASATDTLGHRFYCEMIPEATHTCAKAIDMPRLNAAHKDITQLIFSDQMAVAAYRKGWVNGLSRKYVSLKVIEYIRTRGTQWYSRVPMDCLSQTQQKNFLLMSLDIEEQIVRDGFMSKQEGEELKTGFSNAAKEYKLCSWDFQAILLRDWGEWENLFKRMTLNMTSNQ